MSPRTRRGALSTLVLAGSLLGAAPALAAPPANDAPAAAAAFSTVTAENGTPNAQQGIGELVEATGDAGVPRCLGPDSLDRTVWFRVPEATVARELAVEASGRTLAVIDVVAFVQPAGASASAPVTTEPNACGGVGAGGADASEEATGGVVLRVPAGRAVLVQIGRRGPRGAAEDERAIVSLASRDLPAVPAPAGDEAAPNTPAVTPDTTAPVALGGATLTAEDPAQPPCPSIGSVWRRVVPTTSGSRNVTVTGDQVGTLAVFSGDRPTGDNVVDCLNREKAGAMVLTVTAVAGQPLWIRMGTDRPPADATASLRFAAGSPVADGGPGGSPPVLTNPGSSPKPKPAPAACRPIGRAPKPNRRDTRVRFASIGGTAASRNRSRTLTLRISRLTGRARSGRVVVVGPCKRVYARSAFKPLKRGGRVRLTRTRAFVKGTYRLTVDVRRQVGGRRIYVPVTVTFRLR